MLELTAQTFQEKCKVIMTSKFAKKIQEKSIFCTPPLPSKKVLRLRLRKKTCRSADSTTLLYVHLWGKLL